MNPQTEFNNEDYNWTEKSVIGLSLLVMGGKIDSFGETIKGDLFYVVGKHKQTGQVCIFPTKKNAK